MRLWRDWLNSLDIPESSSVWESCAAAVKALGAARTAGFYTGSRAFFSRFARGASAKTVCTIRRARSDIGKISEKCSKKNALSTKDATPAAIKPNIHFKNLSSPSTFANLASMRNSSSRKSLLVATTEKACDSRTASVRASACFSLNPAPFSVRTNLCVSNAASVIVQCLQLKNFITRPYFPEPRRQPLHAHRPGFNGLGEYVGRAENRDGLPRAGDRGIDEFARERARGQILRRICGGQYKGNPFEFRPL